MRATLRKYEILSSAKRIDALFSKGTTLSAYPVRAVFLYIENEPRGLSPVQVLFTIPGRNFRKATRRNLLRRRLKEAFRKNKQILYTSALQNQGTLYLALLYTSKQAESYATIEKSVIKLLHEINLRFQSTKQENSEG